MTKKQNKIIFLFTGILIGVLSSIGVYKLKSSVDEIFSYKIDDYSSEKLRSKISKVGIELPEKAYNIEFYYTGWQDYSCWLAFSASEKEVRKLFPRGEIQDKVEYKPTHYIPKDKDGNILLDWWPKNTEGFEILYGHQCWMGYDKKNSRLYIYKFSQ